MDDVALTFIVYLIEAIVTILLFRWVMVTKIIPKLKEGKQAGVVRVSRFGKRL